MQDIETFDIGDKVKHPKFGAGTVMFRTGEGDKQKVTVKFGAEIGEKKLMAGLAKMKLISERPTLAPEAVEAVPGRAKLATSKDDDDDDDSDDDDDNEDDDDGDDDDADDSSDDEDED